MNIGIKLVNSAISRPRLVTLTMVIITLLLGSLISLVEVDTDPENMLSEDEIVRIFHHQVKKDFEGWFAQ
jgi:predicted RND superfamily exporter protein